MLTVRSSALDLGRNTFCATGAGDVDGVGVGGNGVFEDSGVVSPAGGIIGLFGAITIGVPEGAGSALPPVCGPIDSDGSGISGPPSDCGIPGVIGMPGSPPPLHPANAIGIVAASAATKHNFCNLIALRRDYPIRR
ncbi:MAG TPA: hypothetical protein VFE36_09560 [Candidatus Baltobacteraceae bacterium]|nr:hypothetical protein [Candidatus Baltobacteraceae bacterium]